MCIRDRSQPLIAAASAFSRTLLVVAIAAAAIKTSLDDLRQLGWRPVTMLLGETAALALLAGMVIAAGAV